MFYEIHHLNSRACIMDYLISIKENIKLNTFNHYNMISFTDSIIVDSRVKDRYCLSGKTISLVWVHGSDTEATALFRWFPSSFSLYNLYSGLKLQRKAENHVICPCHVTSASMVYSSKGPCWSQNSLVAPTHQVQRGFREVRVVYINGCNTELAPGTRN